MEHARTKGGVHIKRCLMRSPTSQLFVLLGVMEEYLQRSMSWVPQATLLMTGSIPDKSHSPFTNQLGQPPCSQGCVCSATQANKYSQEQLRLMKGQDIKHLALKAQAEAKVTLCLMHFPGPSDAVHCSVCCSCLMPQADILVSTSSLSCRNWNDCRDRSISLARLSRTSTLCI